MDEQMIGDGGEVRRFAHDIIDENHKGLTFWTDKHNRYADRKVRDILSGEAGDGGRHGDQAGRTRWLKGNVYLRAPLFLRAFLYWFYRYVLRLAALDGRAGLVFHFLRGFWYRFLVDAKHVEVRRRREDAAGAAGGRRAQRES